MDIVAGYVPDGPRTPTIDLRLQTLGPVPSDGEVRLRARPLRVGRNLVVSETLLADGRGHDFARASATFMNRRIEGIGITTPVPPRSRVESFDGMLEARPLSDGRLDLEPVPRLGNGWVGTVQGGVQALLAECAAERIATDGYEVVDLDIRYLSRLETGPLRAVPRRLGVDGGLETFSVALDDGRLDLGAVHRRAGEVAGPPRHAPNGGLPRLRGLPAELADPVDQETPSSRRQLRVSMPMHLWAPL